MKRLIPIFCMLVVASALAQEPTDANAKKEVLEDNYPSTVHKQMGVGGLIDALVAAKSVEVQMISVPTDCQATNDGGIVEGNIHAISKRIVLTSEERALLLAAPSDDTVYDESDLVCLCYFQPQLRVRFAADSPKRSFDILLSGTSHGEIQVYVNAEHKAYARTWHFIPKYLELLDSLFPKRDTTQMLHRVHEMRMKEVANKAATAQRP